MSATLPETVVPIRLDMAAFQADLKAALGSVKAYSTQATAEITKTEKAFKDVGMAAKALKKGFAALGGMDTLNTIIQTNAEFERMAARVNVLEGSARAGAAQMSRLQDFARKTPEDLNGVIDAYATLRSAGLEPTDRLLNAIGNTAAGNSEKMGIYALAVADAASGQLDSLRAFGIEAAERGNEVDLTFKGVTVTLENTSGAILEYLQTIGESNFADGMATGLDSLNGQFNSLSDAVTEFYVAIGQSGLNDIVIGGLSGVTETVKFLTDNFNALAQASAVAGAAVAGRFIPTIALATIEMGKKIQTVTQLMSVTRLMTTMGGPLGIGLGLAAGALALLATEFLTAETYAKSFDEAQKTLNNTLAGSEEKYRKVAETIKTMTNNQLTAELYRVNKALEDQAEVANILQSEMEGIFSSGTSRVGPIKELKAVRRELKGMVGDVISGNMTFDDFIAHASKLEESFTDSDARKKVKELIDELLLKQDAVVTLTGDMGRLKNTQTLVTEQLEENRKASQETAGAVEGLEGQTESASTSADKLSESAAEAAAKLRAMQAAAVAFKVDGMLNGVERQRQALLTLKSEGMDAYKELQDQFQAEDMANSTESEDDTAEDYLGAITASRLYTEQIQAEIAALNKREGAISNNKEKNDEFKESMVELFKSGEQELILAQTRLEQGDQEANQLERKWELEQQFKDATPEKIDAFIAEEERQAINLEKIQTEIDQVEKLTEDLELEDGARQSLVERYAAIDAAKDAGLVKLAAERAGITESEAMVRLHEKAYQDWLNTSNTAFAGVVNSLNNYVETAGFKASNVETAMTGVLTNVNDFLVDATTKGELEIDGLVDHIQKSFLRMAYDELIISPVAGAMSGVLSGIGSAVGSSGIVSSIGGFLAGIFAEGGRISGPGGPTDDRILALVSNGEFVMRASAVDKYGWGFMEAINAGALPAFRGGGGPGGGTHGSRGGGGGADRSSGGQRNGFEGSPEIGPGRAAYGSGFRDNGIEGSFGDAHDEREIGYGVQTISVLGLGTGVPMVGSVGGFGFAVGAALTGAKVSPEFVLGSHPVGIGMTIGGFITETAVGFLSSITGVPKSTIMDGVYSWAENEKITATPYGSSDFTDTSYGGDFDEMRALVDAAKFYKEIGLFNEQDAKAARHDVIEESSRLREEARRKATETLDGKLLSGAESIATIANDYKAANDALLGVTALGQGGVAVSPTLALIGDKREAIVPFDNAGALPLDQTETVAALAAQTRALGKGLRGVEQSVETLAGSMTKLSQTVERGQRAGFAAGRGVA